MLQSFFPRLGAALIIFCSGAVGHAASTPPPSSSPPALSPQSALADSQTQTARTIEGSPTVHLASLFWPPYTGKDLPYGGIDTKLIRQTLAQEGLDLKVDFMPWPRALAMFEAGKVDGIYPEYPERQYLHTNCAISDAYRSTLLSIAESTSKPIVWNQVTDLARYSIGVVRGYVNSPAFDSLIANGIIKAEIEPSDVINLRKVAARRIEGALIDPNVYRYLTENDVSLQPLIGMIKLNPKPLADRSLHICFNDNSRGLALRRIFNQGIKEHDLSKAPEYVPPIDQAAAPQ